jgi:hypothetical protein
VSKAFIVKLPRLLTENAFMSMQVFALVWLLSVVQAACCCMSLQVSPLWASQLSNSPLRKLDVCVAELDDEAAILACVYQLPATLRELSLDGGQLGISSAVEQTITSSPFSTMQATTLRQVRGPTDVRNTMLRKLLPHGRSNRCGDCMTAVRWMPLALLSMTMFKRKPTSRTYQSLQDSQHRWNDGFGCDTGWCASAAGIPEGVSAGHLCAMYDILGESDNRYMHAAAYTEIASQSR